MQFLIVILMTERPTYDHSWPIAESTYKALTVY